MDEDVEIIGICKMCGEQIDVPHPSDERYSIYANGFITVYAVCDSCEFFDNHDGFFDFYADPDNYKNE